MAAALSRRTPAAVIAKLDKEIEAVLPDEKMKARLIGAGVEPMFMAADEFAKLIVDEAETWGKLVKSAGVKPG
jgi:tripartite-type tricarboxylate transporter receptor subunit TctC